jgi:hypothetical protein
MTEPKEDTHGDTCTCTECELRRLVDRLRHELRITKNELAVERARNARADRDQQDQAKLGF